MDNNEQVYRDIEQMQQGDFSDYENFYNLTSQYVYQVLYNILGEQDVALGLINETYSRVYQNIGQVADKEYFYQWMGMNATDIALGYLNNAGVEAHIPDEGTYPFDYEYAYQDGEPMISEKQLRDMAFQQSLQAHINALPVVHKVILQYYYYAGLGVSDISAKTGYSVLQVKAILGSIRQNIRDVIGAVPTNDDSKMYSLSEIPVLWVIFQSVLSYSLGINIAGNGVAGIMAAKGAGDTAAGGVVAANEAAGAVGGIAGGEAAGAAAGGSAATGILSTMGAKIALGIAGAALIAGGGFALHHFLSTDSKEKESTTASEEMTSEVTEETSEELSTEQDIDADEYKQPYLAILEDNEQSITEYRQNRQILGSDDWRSDNEDTPVAITDITGDGVPELIYIAMDDEYTAGLYIYTMEDGAAKQIYYGENWDVFVAGGTTYSLFQIEGDNNLYGCTGMADEFTEESYFVLKPNADGTLYSEQLMYRDKTPNDDYSAMIATCTVDGQDVTEDVFQNALDDLTGKMTNLLIYNHNAYDDNATEAMLQSEQSYLTYEDAIALLSDGQSADETSDSVNAKLPFTDTQSFIFSSGVGGWSTDVDINPDGTFTGTYHDSDMGDSGDGYDSTMYICNFSGKFKDIQKIDDYTYSMKLDSIETEDMQDTWIEDVNGTKIRYIAAEPYGMETGEQFYLYLPGTSVSILPEEYVNWVYGLSEQSTLQYYGLYNVEPQYGFYSYQ